MTQMKWVLACVLAVGLMTWTLQAADTQPSSPGGDLRPMPPAKGVEAEKTDAAKPTSQPGAQQPAGGGGGMDTKLILMMLGVMVLLWVWMGRSRKKQEAKRKEMLGALKKGDKITTIGGIIGTVIESRESEVVVKVDESNNVRMRFARWAIRGIGEEAKAEKPEDKDQQPPQQK